MNLSLPGGSVIVRSPTAARRHDRLCAALLGISRAALRASTREGLCREVCRTAVTSGGFLFAWIGWREPDGHMIVPAAQYGAEDESLQFLTVLTDERAERQGPAGVAFRTLKPHVCNDFLRDSPSTLWRAAAERAGIAACAAFPIRLLGVVSGTLTVYAREVGYFDSTELALLQEAAADISYALDVLTRDQDRRSAKDTVRRMSAIIESTGDAIISKSLGGRITSWNPAAARMFGYTIAEVMGRNIRMLIPRGLKADEPEILARIADGERIVVRSFSLLSLPPRHS